MARNEEVHEFQRYYLTEKGGIQYQYIIYVPVTPSTWQTVLMIIVTVIII